MNVPANTPPRPQALPFQARNIPQALKDLDQWVLWKFELVNGGWTKIPYTPWGQRASCSNPSTWLSFAEVYQAYQQGGFDGCSIALAPGDDLAGIDLDKCLDESGEPNALADQVLEQFACTYTELSPSGRGVRIFCYGTPRRTGKGGEGNWIEVYDHTSPRFLTVTGHWMDHAGSYVEAAQEELDWLHEEHMGDRPLDVAVIPQPVDLDDQQILDKARDAANGAEFRRLYDLGDTSSYGGDHSSADLALCNLLAFWTGCDTSRMERLFRGSALYRKKWDRPDYRERTISRAISNCREVYEPGKHFEGGEVAVTNHAVATVSQSTRNEKPLQQADYRNFRGNRNLFELAGVELDQLPILPERPGAVEFPILPYHNLILAVQDRTQAPYELCAQSVLATMTLAVQHLADIEMPGIDGAAARRPISNFFLTIAESGERKSSVDRIALEGVEGFQQAAERHYKDQNLRYQQQLHEHRQAESTAHRNGQVFLEEEPKPPREPIVLTKEPTQEGLFRSLEAGQLSQGLFSDEGGSFLGGYGMSRDSRMRTAAFLNSLWDGSKLSKTRATEHRTLRGRRFSVHLMLQPKASDQVFGDAMLADIGFTARCLVAEPQSTIGTRLFHEPARESVMYCEEFARIIQSLLAFDEQDAYDAIPRPAEDEETEATFTRKEQLRPRILPLTDNAKALWIEFYNEVERGLASEYATIKGFAGKAPEHAIRLAAVLHLFGDPERLEQEGVQNIGPRCEAITQHGMAYGIALARYYLAQHLRLQTARPSEQDEEAQLLMDWLRSNWKERFISRPDICRSGPNRLRSRDKAQEAIELCVQTGHLKLWPKPEVIKGNKRQQVYEVAGFACDSATEAANHQASV